MKEIPILRPFMPQGIGPLLEEVLTSGWIGEGPWVARFEQELGSYIGNPHVACVNSGTSAIWLALHLANVGPGDEVLTTPITCAATNIPLLHRYIRPVWVDVDPASGLMDIDRAASLVTAKTKAILCVDLFGNPCDYDKLLRFARQHDLLLIADSAQALGAQYHGRKLGTIADITCFSFQSVKLITTADGGAICVSSPELLERVRRLRWFGLDRNKKRSSPTSWIQDIEEAGYKFHMNDVAAFIGCQQLQHLGTLLDHHRNNARFYDEQLAGLPGIQPIRITVSATSNYWVYALLVERRGEFIEFMRQCGIQVSPLHQSNLQLSIFKKDFAQTALEQAEEFDRKIVCIPTGHWVKAEERQHIATSIRQYAAMHRAVPRRS